MTGKPLSEQNQGELKVTMTAAADAVKAALPPKSTFIILAADPGSGVGHYIANVHRSTVVAFLRETADRLESRQEVAREPFRE